MRNHQFNRTFNRAFFSTVRGASLLLVAICTFAVTMSVSANVTSLLLGRRNCESVTAFVRYDGGSVGHPPYLAAFAVDLNGDGKFGQPEAGESTVFSRLGPNATAARFARGVLKFKPVPEGTIIAVTAYEVDSGGRIVSEQLTPVTFKCTNTYQTKQIPATPPPTVPAVIVSARVTASPRIPVYAAPNGQTEVGGLATGAVVSAIGRNSRGDWLQIPFGGGTAWIMWNTNALVFGPYKSLPVTAN